MVESAFNGTVMALVAARVTSAPFADAIATKPRTMENVVFISLVAAIGERCHA